MKLDFSVLLREDYPRMIIEGVITMLKLTAYSWLLAMAVGIVLAVVRMTNNRVAGGVVAGYVEYHQNVPMLVQIFLWYFGVPTLLPDSVQLWFNMHRSDFLFAAIAVGLAMGAYMSEGLRAGIRSIPRSQMVLSQGLAPDHPAAGVAPGAAHAGELQRAAVQEHQPGDGDRRGRADLRHARDRKPILPHRGNLPGLHHDLPRHLAADHGRRRGAGKPLPHQDALRGTP
jgi:His/Glu/Gln/Arg/opine family amino acid ABC transporter permease subunit